MNENVFEKRMANDIRDILMNEGNGGYITANKRLIHGIGLHEAIIYSELVSKYAYYQEKGYLEDNEFYCTIQDMQTSTGISQTAQTSAYKRLKELKLIDYCTKGIPPKRYISVLDTPNENNNEEHILIKYINLGQENINALEEKAVKKSNKLAETRQQFKQNQSCKDDVKEEKTAETVGNQSVRTNVYNSTNECTQCDIQTDEQVLKNQCNSTYESINNCVQINEQVRTNVCNVINESMPNNNNNNKNSEEEINNNDLITINNENEIKKENEKDFSASLLTQSDSYDSLEYDLDFNFKEVLGEEKSNFTPKDFKDTVDEMLDYFDSQSDINSPVDDVIVRNELSKTEVSVLREYASNLSNIEFAVAVEQIETGKITLKDWFDKSLCCEYVDYLNDVKRKKKQNKNSVGVEEFPEAIGA